MERGNFDWVGTEVTTYQTRPDRLLVPRRACIQNFRVFAYLTKTNTRLDRMVCSCREEHAHEFSGSESMGIGFYKSACRCLEGRSGEMERGNFDLVGTEVNNYQTRPDGLLVPRRARIRSFRA